MAIVELSNIIFTDQDDIVPPLGEEIITNTGIANTLGGNDRITGTATPDLLNSNGITNISTLNTADGNDMITGTGSGRNSGIFNLGFIDTGDDNDEIAGITTGTGDGITNVSSAIDTGNGNDVIIGRSTSDGIYNDAATINTGNGDDVIFSEGNFTNKGGVFLGDGNDRIQVEGTHAGRALQNFNFIGTGDGNDTITGVGTVGGIYNEGIIETGNGDDSIIVGIPGFLLDTIDNNGGRIDTGKGNDRIIAETFFSGSNSSGAWFLGEGEDYIRGFGSGDFYGGSGNDTLELAPGTYTVGIWGEAGESPIFTKGNQLMITSEFETLIAGGTTYNFASLTAGQTITVA
jgi:hypothetical protein